MIINLIATPAYRQAGSPVRECVVKLLRGSKITEAISQCIESKEIATLLLVARNDKKGVTTQSPRERENNLILRGSFSIVFEKLGIRVWGLGIRKKSSLVLVM